MTRNDWRTLGKLLDKGNNLIEQERSLQDALLRQLNAESTSEEKERLLRAVSLTSGTALAEISRAKLRACSLTETQIDLFDDVRIRRHNKESVTPEEERNFEIVCGLVNRCWGGGGGDPPDGNDGPDFGRTIADLIAKAHADDDEKDEPSPTVPPQEPNPMQPDLRPKAEEEAQEKQKGKPRLCGTPRRGGWEIG